MSIWLVQQINTVRDYAFYQWTCLDPIFWHGRRLHTTDWLRGRDKLQHITSAASGTVVMKGLMILLASMGVVSDEKSVNVMREWKWYHLEYRCTKDSYVMIQPYKLPLRPIVKCKMQWCPCLFGTNLAQWIRTPKWALDHLLWDFMLRRVVWGDFKGTAWMLHL